MEWFWDQAKLFFTSAGVKILLALLVLLVGFFLTGRVSALLKRLRILEKVDKSAASFLRNTASIALRILVVVTALMVLGIPATSFITILASAGVTIGLALQGSLSNLAGGLMLMFFRPYGVGDTIRAMNMEGTVKEISAFYTTLVTKDNSRVILPNGALNNSCIVNYSAEKTRKIQLSLSVPCAGAQEWAVSEVLAFLNRRAELLKEPAPEVKITARSAANCEITVICWCSAEKHDDILLVLKDEILCALEERKTDAA